MALKWLLDYRFWIVFIVVAILLLWIFFGGEKQEFIGLDEVLKKEKEDIKGLYVEDWRKKYGHKVRQLGYDEETKSETSSADSEENNKNKVVNVKQTNNHFIQYNSSSADDSVIGTIQSYSANNSLSDTEELTGESYSISENTLRSELVEGKVAFYRKQRNPSKGEAECKRCMEQIYGRTFYTVRPDWLKNPETGRNLEIDCYNDTIKVGVEYNGIQHYVHPNFTGQSHDDFVKQVRRDQLKIDLCDANGVYLITVPYTVKIPDIYDYIVARLPPEN